MSRASIRYAKAIFDVAQAAGSADAVQSDLSMLQQTLETHQELNLFMHSPIIASELKLNALIEIMQGAQKETIDLFRLLKANKRFEILSEVAHSYAHVFDAHKGFEEATVTTAVALDAALESKVMAKAQTLSKQPRIVLKNIIDPSIIGGYILRVGDIQYNASVANKLQDLKQKFSN
ncbi:MAG: ATP synthase F1 subunit delta [Flavobacterium sp. BFFFF2]|nr:MAG: ATP synthase F1 subunit delta [Flavobacterium sp. BFFFF2]